MPAASSGACVLFVLFCFAVASLLPAFVLSLSFPVVCLCVLAYGFALVSGSVSVKQRSRVLLMFRGGQAKAGLAVRVPCGLANASLSRSLAVARMHVPGWGQMHGSAPSAHLGPRDWKTGAGEAERGVALPLPFCCRLSLSDMPRNALHIRDQGSGHGVLGTPYKPRTNYKYPPGAAVHLTPYLPRAKYFASCTFLQSRASPPEL